MDKVVLMTSEDMEVAIQAQMQNMNGSGTEPVVMCAKSLANKW